MFYIFCCAQYIMYKSRKNNAQKARRDSRYYDLYSKTRWENDNTGGKVKVTRYSDGSSTYHFGGPCGSQDYDEFGNEC